MGARCFIVSGTTSGIGLATARALAATGDTVVMANRDRFPFKDIVDSKFSLDELDTAFEKAAERSILRAAIVP